MKEIVNFPDTTTLLLENISILSGSNEKLHGWFMKSKNKEPKATVLLFHGNAGNVGYQYRSLVPLLDSGFQAIVFDYRGFGKSEGEASQEKILEDGIAALNFVNERKDCKNIPLILFGQSLGGHLAAVVAARKETKIDALVIEGAFSGHEEIAVYAAKTHYHSPEFLTRLFVPSVYDAYKEASKISVPTLIIHSTEDEICPIFMGKQIYDSIKSQKEFWQIKGPHIRCSKLYKEEFVEKFKSILRK